jgi:hypothetical protein
LNFPIALVKSVSHVTIPCTIRIVPIFPDEEPEAQSASKVTQCADAKPCSLRHACLAREGRGPSSHQPQEARIQNGGGEPAQRALRPATRPPGPRHRLGLGLEEPLPSSRGRSPADVRLQLQLGDCEVTVLRSSFSLLPDARYSELSSPCPQGPKVSEGAKSLGTAGSGADFGTRRCSSRAHISAAWRRSNQGVKDALNHAEEMPRRRPRCLGDVQDANPRCSAAQNTWGAGQ